MIFFLVEGLGDAEVIVIGFTLVGKLTLPLAYFHVDLRISLSFLANEVAHAGLSQYVVVLFFSTTKCAYCQGERWIFFRENC